MREKRKPQTWRSLLTFIVRHFTHVHTDENPRPPRVTNHRVWGHYLVFSIYYNTTQKAKKRITNTTLSFSCWPSRPSWMTCRHESQGWVVSDLPGALGRARRTGRTIRPRRRRAKGTWRTRGWRTRGWRTRGWRSRGRRPVVVWVVWWMMHLLFFFKEAVVWRRGWRGLLNL